MSINSLDEETALSIIFGNTKKKKRNVDLVTLAKTFRYLVNLYGSQAAAAKKVGLSTEMIREFLSTLKLPTEIQQLISARKIDSVDIVREISSLKDRSNQIAAANALMSSSSKDVRDIKRLVAGSSASIEDAKNVVTDLKPKGLHIFVMDVDDETYRLLLKRSKAMKLKPAEVARDIVSKWLKRMYKGDK
jgi:hypothetical protein